MLFSTVISYIAGFFQKITEKVVINKITDNLKKISLPKLRKKRVYFEKLETSIKQMPFIYEESLHGEVLDDFININIQTVDPIDFEIRDNIPINREQQELISSQKLKEDNKLLIIGNAGVGKTTLLTYTVLSIIKRREIKYLNFINLRKTIPIFIPLKAIKNSQESPIIKFILENVDVFNSRNGLAILKSYALQKRIFLALDGYDEISFASKEKYIQHEITALLSSNTQNNFLDKKYIELYEALQSCRIWLSTRLEFYKLNPIITKDQGQLLKLQNTQLFSILKINGLGNNRLNFVRKIFCKYYTKAIFFKDLLDEEQFIEDIDTTYDEKLIELSYTPLYLTIMCYLYVKQVESRQELPEEWLNNFEDLVKQCVDIMLNDLDKFKVRNLPLAQRKAFLSRRNSFLEEKKQFLNQFALLLLINDMNVFDIHFLKKSVIKFFKEDFESANSKKILFEFDESKSNNPNFAEQLIFSGLFSLVNVEKGNYQYDFPHRRFKEVLALTALEKEYNLKLLENNLTKESLSEFILLVFSQNNYYRQQILSMLLNSLHNDSANKYINLLLKNCLDKFNDKLDATVSSVFENWIYAKLNSNEIVTLYRSHFKFVTFSPSFLYNIEQISENNKNSINTLLFFFSILRINFFKEFCSKITFDFNDNKKTKNKRIEGLITKFFVIDVQIFKDGLRDFVYDQDNYIDLYKTFANNKFTKTDIIKNNFSIDVLGALGSNSYYTDSRTEYIIESIQKNLSIVERIIYTLFLKYYNEEKYDIFSKLTENFNLIELSRYIIEEKEYKQFKSTQIVSNIEDENRRLQKNITAKKNKNVTESEDSRNKSRMKLLVAHNQKILRDVNSINEDSYTRIVEIQKNIKNSNYNYLKDIIS